MCIRLNMSPVFLLAFCLVSWLGLTGILYKKSNIFLVLFSVELMYLGIISMYMILSVLTQQTKGQFFGLIILILAASESAVGLGILITLYRWGGKLAFHIYDELSG